MQKIKTLYELAKNKLYKLNCDYQCGFCGLLDYDKYYVRGHIRYKHSDYEKELKIYRCRRCRDIVNFFQWGELMFAYIKTVYRMI